MLGIVGDNGAGKTTLKRGIVQILGAQGVTPICLDDYLLYSRAERFARGMTKLDPSGANIDLMTEHLATLRAGGHISKPIYDYRSGMLRGPELVVATGLVIAHGMFTLATPELAELFDLTVYLETDEPLRSQWKMQRDLAQRGYTLEQVEADYHLHERDAPRFIYPQRRHADLVVRFFLPTTSELPADTVQLSARVTQRCHLARLDLGDLRAYEAQQQQPRFRQRYDVLDDDGCNADIIEIDGDIGADEAAALQVLIRDYLPGLPFTQPNQIGSVIVKNEERHSDTLALVQILVAYHLLHARRTEG